MAMDEHDYYEEAQRLLDEASSYLHRGLPEGAAWRAADALHWLKKAGLCDCGGIDKPTGLGAMLKSVTFKEGGKR